MSLIIGEGVLARSLGNQNPPRPWRRPGGADEQPDRQGQSTSDPAASLREALSQSFKRSSVASPQGLTGDFAPLPVRRLRADTRTPVADRRTRELRWRQDNDQVLETLAGQWLVVEGDELVAHGQDPVALVSAARQRGIRVPFLFFVEPRASDTVKIGL